MRVRQLQVVHYRGIEKLLWTLDSGFVCLVGPGDSTKTTVLDALGAVLNPRYNVVFTDADFYKCDVTSPIVITAVITDLPDKLIEERAHGKNRSGFRADGSLEHDPLDEEGVEECLIVRLTVDQTLEPVWEGIRPDDEVGDRITAGERGQLGFFRIGEATDSHLRWGRSSALSGLTASKTDVAYAVVEAQRQARTAVAELSDTPLHAASAIAQAGAVRLGSAPFENLRPGLDSRSGGGSAALVLHEGEVPLTNYGLGSRRLTSLAVQAEAIQGQSIVAIDEVERGLEPHRLLHLLRHLRERASDGELQAILTTHSSLAVESLDTTELFVVRSTSGTTTVSAVPEELGAAEADVLQGLVRDRPSTLLARRVVVGEGATETGFLRRILYEWDRERSASDALTAVTAGVAVSNGAGDDLAPKRARALALLGYPTLLVVDNDTTSGDAALDSAKEAGVTVVRWPEGWALEDAVCQALPVPGLQELVELAADETSEEGVLAGVASRFGVDPFKELDVSGWCADHQDSAVREAIAAAAKGRKTDGSKAESKAWFKREDRGERLGALVFARRSDLGGSKLAEGLQAVKQYAYSDVPPPPDAPSNEGD